MNALRSGIIPLAVKRGKMSEKGMVTNLSGEEKCPLLALIGRMLERFWVFLKEMLGPEAAAILETTKKGGMKEYSPRRRASSSSPEIETPSGYHRCQRLKRQA